MVLMGGVSVQVLSPSPKTKMTSTANQIHCHQLVSPSRERPSRSAPVLLSLVLRLDGRSSRKCLTVTVTVLYIWLDSGYIRRGFYRSLKVREFFISFSWPVKSLIRTKDVEGHEMLFFL